MTVVAVERQYGAALRVEHRDISTADGLESMLAMEDEYHAPQGSPPRIFVAGHCLNGAAEIRNQFQAIVAKELASRKPSASQPASRPGEPSSAPAASASGLGSDGLSRGFDSMATGAVLVAGLIDGVYPCALTIAVLLISMLTFLGRTRRQVVIVGAVFSLTVLAACFLMRLGELRAL